MKKFFNLGIFSLLILLSACSGTQLMKEGVNFTDKKTFYVDMPRGGGALFNEYGDRTVYDAILLANIRANLESKGYVFAERDVADMIICPLWNTSLLQNTEGGIYMNNTLSVGAKTQKVVYCTLEIHILFQGSEDWVWRGISNHAVCRENLAESTLATQVNWCFSEFPPELYPERKLKKADEEENPFASIVPDTQPANPPSEPVKTEDAAK